MLSQILAFVFSASVVYFSFRDLNACGPYTHWTIRFPILISFAAGSALLLVTLMGVILNWVTILVMAALCVKLASERRRETPFVNPVLKKSTR